MEPLLYAADTSESEKFDARWIAVPLFVVHAPYPCSDQELCTCVAWGDSHEQYAVVCRDALTRCESECVRFCMSRIATPMLVEHLTLYELYVLGIQILPGVGL
jgi:hypothetical protein